MATEHLPVTGVSTAVYLSREGVRTKVFHCSRTGKWQWEHVYTEQAIAECKVCSARTGR